MADFHDSLDRALVHTAPHDRGLSWPTVATVDLMLRQLRRDRQTAYWGEPPHSSSLDGAESWLLSLRDWLESSWPAVTRGTPPTAGAPRLEQGVRALADDVRRRTTDRLTAGGGIPYYSGPWVTRELERLLKGGA